MATAPTKLKAPTVKFDKVIAAGKIADAIKASGSAKMGILLNVPVAAINVIPGFNVRVETPDYIEHRDNIVQSIRNNGYYETMPLAGFVAVEDGKQLLYLTGGHTRFDAIKTINADPDLPEEKEIKTVPMIVRTGGTLEELTVALHTENDGNKLTPLELGTVVKRLLGFPNATQESVGAKLGITPRYLRDVLMLVDSPAAVKQAVLDGNVSSTFAIQTLKTKKDKAGEVIAAAVKSANGKKATAKDAKPAASVPMEKLEHVVNLGEGDTIKAILAATATHLRAHFGIPEGDGPITHDGKLVLTIHRPKVTAAKVEAKVAEADAAKGAADKLIEAAAATKKPRKKAAAPTTTAPAPAPSAVAEVEDEPLIALPPAVKDGPGTATNADDDGDI